MRTCAPVRLLLLALAITSAAHAQLAQTWAGEWGRFQPISTPAGQQYRGYGVSISKCDGSRCAVSLSVQEPQSTGDAQGFLQLGSAVDGIAHLMSLGAEHCSLRFHLAPERPAITVSPGTGDCSYFLTPSATFQHTYDLHSRADYIGERLPECFAATAASQIALCTDAALSALRDQWQSLYWQLDDLYPAAPTRSLQPQRTAQDKLANSCEHSTALTGCLNAAFTKAIEDLEARKTVWFQSVTEPGEAMAARKAAASIAGSYRHRFANGDVQGDKYFSTNRILIDRLPGSDIHYSLALSFYNGHECSLDGTASFRRAGFFVDQKQTDQPKSPVCVFEIIPEPTGIRLADPTGACRIMSCGARGGYNGTRFSFKDRRATIPTLPVGAAPK